MTTLKLYKCREDGSVGLLEVSRGNFSDADSYQQALDFHYEQGYCDTREEALDAYLGGASIPKSTFNSNACGDSFSP